MGCCAAKNDMQRGNGQDLADQQCGLFSQRLAEIYKKYDTNHDGCLDREETRELLNGVLKEQGRTVNEHDLEEFINAADSNRDGKIQKNELMQLYKKLENKTRRSR